MVPDTVFTAAPPSDQTLEAVLSLSSKFEQQNQLAMRKFNEQQEQINAIKQQLPFRPSHQRQDNSVFYSRRAAAGNHAEVFLKALWEIVSCALHREEDDNLFAAIFAMV